MSNKRHFPIKPRRRRQGFALIEVLVGMLIFAFGVLGLMGLQASMTQATTSNKFRADASNIANELLGLMWSDAPANLSKYTTAQCAGYGRCLDWSRKVSDSLPKGTATVTATDKSGAGSLSVVMEVQVDIAWTPPGGESTHHYRTLARVEP